jgi:hypothetical protein
VKKLVAILLIGLLIAPATFAQDSLRMLKLNEVQVQGRRVRIQAAPVGLYAGVNPDNIYENIAGFASLIMLDGPAGNELWSDSKKGCLKVVLQSDSSYHLQWDKPGGGCNWVGMGVGWDQWSGKNMSSILDSAAIELRVRIPAGKPARTLPLAFGLEDYSNRQAWMGMSARWVVDGPIGQEYAHIRLPLQQFNWEEQRTDPGNIKQFIIQFEAAGEVDLRHIRIVRHKAQIRNSMVAQKHNDRYELPWQQLGHDAIQISWDDRHLYIHARLHDTRPLENNKSGADLWNGDALELAFAAQPEQSTRPRARMLFSDLHLGISLGEQAEAVSFRTQKNIPIVRKLDRSNDGQELNVTIAWADLDRSPWKLPGRYLIEMARDIAGANGRAEQKRWNSIDEEGFHLSPVLWGEFVLPVKNQEP